MPGPMLHVGAIVQCTHGASAQAAPGSSRVLVSSQPAATLADTFTVSGCSFQIPVGAGTKPSPCLTIRWTVPAVRVKVNGTPALTSMSAGLGLSPEQAPQGPAIPGTVQTRVVIT